MPPIGIGSALSISESNFCSNFFGLVGTKDHPKGNAKILVHCMAVVSRSATFTAAYLMRDHKLNVREALRTMLDKRVIFPNDGFLKCLLNYNKQLGYVN